MNRAYVGVDEHELQSELLKGGSIGDDYEGY